MEQDPARDSMCSGWGKIHFWPNVRQKGELCANIGGLADKYLPWPDGGKLYFNI